MKKIFINFVFIFGLIFGLTNVNALSYTAYETGDEIKVNVNNTEKISFYVLEDSDKDSDTVTAITYDVIDEETYTYDESETLLVSTKTIWENTDNVYFPTMQILFGDDVDLNESFEFDNPEWAKSKYTYWTSTPGEEGWNWTIGVDISKNGQAGVFEKTQKMYVRPVIEISKEYVEGGVIRTPFEDFEYYFKNSESLDYLEYDDMTIVSDNNKLSIKLVVDENTYNTEYAYVDGVVTYSKAGDKYYDSYFNYIVMEYVIDKFDYNYYKFYKYIYNNDKLTISNDGLEYTLGELYTEEEMEKLIKEWEEYVNSLTKEEQENLQGMGFANETIFNSLKVDIVNGAKTYDESLIAYYDVVEGENQKYINDKSTELKFEIDAEFSLFDSVYIDGKKIDASNYTVADGSTIITLKKAYLDTLNNGVHTMKVTYKDGDFAETQFTIEKNEKNPNTGISTQYGILSILILIGLSMYLIIRNKTKFPKHN